MDIKKLLFICFAIFLIGCAKESLDEEKPDIKVVFEEKTEKTKEPEKEEIVYVKIHKFRFEPETINITIGTTVIWENVDDYNHRIMTPQSGFQSPILKPGDTFKINFDVAGKSYKYVEPGFGVIGHINVKY